MVQDPLSDAVCELQALLGYVTHLGRGVVKEFEDRMQLLQALERNHGVLGKAELRQ